MLQEKKEVKEVGSRLFLFLVRLKLGLFEPDLADQFQINISSIFRKLTTWANYLFFFLGSQPIWPTRECIQKYMQHGYLGMYPANKSHNQLYRDICTDTTASASSVKALFILQIKHHNEGADRNTFRWCNSFCVIALHWVTL